MLQRDEFGVPTIRSSFPMGFFGLCLALGVVLRPVAVVSYIMFAIRGVDETGQTLPADWQLMFRTLAGVILIESVLFIITAWYYFNRRKAARTLVLATLLFAIASLAVQTAWTVALHRGEPELIAQELGPAVPALLIAVAWLAYFWRSKRVRETLVYPLSAE
jgi:hypothetical protein